MLKFWKSKGQFQSLFSCCSRLSVGLERICYLLVVSLLVVHLLACMWVFVGLYDQPNTDSWVVVYGQIDSTNFDIYISACYWCVTTLATVGFGDIVAENTIERIYNSCVMLFGVVFYSYVIGTVTGLLSDLDRRQAKLAARLSALQDIAAQFNVSKKFFMQLKSALEQDQYNTRKDRQDVLNSLPRKLAARLTFVMHRQLLSNNRFFKKRSLKFLQSMLPLLRPTKARGGEVIYKSQEMSDESNLYTVYFVGKGKLAYFVDELHVHVIYEVIDDNGYFGEVEFFFADQRENNVKATTICDLLILTRGDLFNRLFLEFSDLKLEMIIEAAATRDRLKYLREEVWSKRRAQYRHAKGLSITLSHNEIGKLAEMQPSLHSELVFEPVPRHTGGTVPSSPLSKARTPLSAGVQSEKGFEQRAMMSLMVPQRSAHNSPYQTPIRIVTPPDLVRENTDESSESGPEIEPFELEKESSRRGSRRSVTNPQSPRKEAEGVQMRITGLKSIMNSHTLALVEEKKTTANEETMKTFRRVTARVTRVEEAVAKLASAAAKRRKIALRDTHTLH